MKRRFVRAMLAAVAATGFLSGARSASAQEVQLTGPLKGAPAVRHLVLYRGGRFEIAPTVSFSLQDEYRRTILAGARLEYNITDWLAIGVWGAAGVVSTPTALTTEIDQTAPRDTLTVTNVNHTGTTPTTLGPASFAAQTAKIDYVIAPQLTFIPFRGKLAIFNKIFVDTDLYAAGGVAFVGIEERKDCGGANQLSCSDPNSFALGSTTKVAPTVGIGLTFFLAKFMSLGVEYRALPFAWNRAGFDTRGSGPNGNFPDGKIDSQDETFRFNQLLTVSLGFYIPGRPKVSE